MTTSGNPARIVVIGDDKNIVELIAMLLEDEGYDVAVRGPELLGLQETQGNSGDLIILDLSLRSVDPLTVLSAFGTNELTLRTPVLCLSATPWLTETASAQPNVVGIVEKPFNVEQLLAKIQEVLP